MDLDELHSRIQQTTLEIRQQEEVSERCKLVYLQVIKALKALTTKLVNSEDVIRSKAACLSELFDMKMIKLSQLKPTSDSSSHMQ